jgi:hypothetical protein
MKNPVIAEDGYTYERENIEQWFRNSESLISPVTYENMKSTKLIVNKAVKKITDRYWISKKATTKSIDAWFKPKKRVLRKILDVNEALIAACENNFEIDDVRSLIEEGANVELIRGTRYYAHIQTDD